MRNLMFAALAALFLLSISVSLRFIFSQSSGGLRFNLWTPRQTPRQTTIAQAVLLNVTSQPALRVLSGAANSKPRFVMLGDQEAWGGYVSKEFHEFFRVLKSAYNWGYIEGGSWTEVADNLAATGTVPAVLLLVERWDIVSWGQRDARIVQGGTLVWMFADDLHWLSEEQRENKEALIRSGIVDTFVGCYMDLLDNMFPGARKIPRVHLPHAASAHFLLPLNPSPAPQVLLAGAAGLPWYPYRALVAEKIANGDARFVQLGHPGYSPEELAAQGARVGTTFADILHGYLAAITDGSILNYTVAKVFEIPATGALLLVNQELSPHLAQLGMYAGVHFFEYSRDTLDGVVDWVLDAAHRPAVDKVRAQGQAIVWARHTVYHRAASLDAAAISASW